MLAKLKITATQQTRTCAIEFDVFSDFRFNRWCDLHLLCTNADKLTSVEQSFRCSLQCHSLVMYSTVQYQTRDWHCILSKASYTSNY